jgi:hypothetical protein
LYPQFKIDKISAMKRVIWLAFFFLFWGGGLGLMAENLKNQERELASLVPREILGWKALEDQTYDPKTIFNYIDGAGEVYRAYNFKSLLARRFEKEGKPALIVDFFDMGRANDAFGVFTHDPEGENIGIGQGSTYKGGLLSFWKDQFFVSVYAEEETEETMEAVLALGREIASAIPKQGEKPALLLFLPAKNLDEKNIHYFHNHLILNYHFYVSNENILLLDQQTEAVLARYGEKGESINFLLVLYPDAKKAEQAYQSFTQAYMPDAKEPGRVKTEDNKWTVTKIKNNLLAIVFNASSEALAKEMIEGLELKLGAKK